MNNEWCEPLMRCAEGLYVLEEETHRVVWANEYITAGLGEGCIGKPCWQVLLGQEGPCIFCPRLKEEEGVYVWDHYDSHRKRWLKIKQLVFRRDGVLYRAGNVNQLDDVMRLNYETVQEISVLRSVLEEKRDELTLLEQTAIYDTLTGLYNRNCFHLDLRRDYVTVAGLGVLYFDLNNLKETNDRHRHEAGDILLRRLAETMRRTTRHMDHAKCYRVGGDEFVIMLKNCTESELSCCAELFDGYLAAYNQNEQYQCSVAVGRAYSRETCDPEALVSCADRQMYLMKQKMKESGKTT